MSFYSISGVLCLPPSVLWTCTHVPYPPNNNHTPNAHIADMEALFSVFHIGEILLYDTPALCQQPHSPGGTESARTRRCAGTQPPNYLSSPMRPPGAIGWCAMDRGGQGAPSPSKFLFFKSKTTSALSEGAPALPGDIASDQVCFCARFRSCPPPGSLLRLPGKFQVIPWAASGGNAGVARLF